MVRVGFGVRLARVVWEVNSGFGFRMVPVLSGGNVEAGAVVESVLVVVVSGAVVRGATVSSGCKCVVPVVVMRGAAVEATEASGSPQPPQNSSKNSRHPARTGRQRRKNVCIKTDSHIEVFTKYG